MFEIFKIFIKNAFSFGLFVTIAMTILELISNNNKHIQLYAFASSSFFIVNFFQYYYIYNNNNSSTSTFLKQSMLGGSLWVLYCSIMLILHYLHFTALANISITSIIIIFITFSHYNLVKYGYFTRL